MCLSLRHKNLFPLRRLRFTLSSNRLLEVNVLSVLVQVELRVLELQQLEEQLDSLWEELRGFYEEEKELWVLRRDLEQAERWLSSYELTLTCDDYGVRSALDLV